MRVTWSSAAMNFCQGSSWGGGVSRRFLGSWTKVLGADVLWVLRLISLRLCCKLPLSSLNCLDSCCTLEIRVVTIGEGERKLQRLAGSGRVTTTTEVLAASRIICLLEKLPRFKSTFTGGAGHSDLLLGASGRTRWLLSVRSEGKQGVSAANTAARPK